MPRRLMIMGETLRLSSTLWRGEGAEAQPADAAPAPEPLPETPEFEPLGDLPRFETMLFDFRMDTLEPEPEAPRASPPVKISIVEAFVLRFGGGELRPEAIAALDPGPAAAPDPGPATVQAVTPAATTDLAAEAAARLAALLARVDPSQTIDAASLPMAEPLPVPADFTGAGQTIVVIDDGYSPFYDQTNTTEEYDFFGFFEDPDASVEKLDSHGSWVAQTALGVAPDADIIHFKVFPDEGGSAYFTDIEQALQAVVEYGEAWGVAAVNLSLGFGNTTDEVLTQLSDELAALDALGIASVAAAGNDGFTYDEGVSVLAADPNVIGVSATTEAGDFAGFSQRDEELTDISALGVGVPVETLDGQTGEVDGTSFSAPYVSASIALLQEASEEILGARLDPDAALEILQLSGEAVEDAPEADGYQVADAEAALQYFIDNSDDYANSLLV